MSIEYTIVNKLYEALDCVSEDLTETNVNHIAEFIDHGEWILALETLCDFIYEDRINISSQTYELLKEVGSILTLEQKNWEMLKPLITG